MGSHQSKATSSPLAPASQESVTITDTITTIPSRMSSFPQSWTVSADSTHLTIVVLGASGDLAHNKTYPALFGLYKNALLPPHVAIVGYARSTLELGAFLSKASAKIKIKTDEEREKLQSFLALCTYVSGQYDEETSFLRLKSHIEERETGPSVPYTARHRLFYMALPPSVFVSACTCVRSIVYSTQGANRLVVEKPFGKDLVSSQELSKALLAVWKEDEIYRIDHYLGKEMVKNIMVLRFANVFFGALWSAQYIANVQITFKEKIGTQGRGGYFDEFGIIRDILQNHLLQIFTIIAMEKPVTADAEAIRDEKVKVLKATAPITLKDTLLGQYTASEDGKELGYLQDSTVPPNSTTPTFAAMVLHVKNARWKGVPFIMKAGKALNEQKCEIRIQFKDLVNPLYPNLARNELVIRVQPNEAVYIKFMAKTPGLVSSKDITTISELDLSYKDRYIGTAIPDAYESLLVDIMKGDKSNFVRADELTAAWKLFTPLLHKIEREKVQPTMYPLGSRGPAQLDDWVRGYGYVRQEDYKWTAPVAAPKM